MDLRDLRAQRSFLALAAVLSLGLPAAAGGTKSGAAAGGEGAASVPVDSALREVLVAGWMVAGWPEEQVVAELVSIGPRAISKLFAIHAGMDFEPWEGEGVSFDRGPERGAFLAGRALCALPRSEVVAYLREHARPGDPIEARMSAIGLYAAIGTLEELVPMLALIGSFSEEDLASPTLRSRLPQDLTHLFERVPRAALDTAGACSAMPAAVRRPVSEALLALDHPCAVEALPAMLGSGVEEDVRVLERLAEVGERYPWRLGAIEPDFVAGLLRAGDMRIRRAACVLAGRWQEVELFEALVRLREQDPQPAVQRAALFALHTLSASKLELDATGWERWHTAQKATWERESAGLLEELASADPALVSQALRRASQFPLHRRDLAPLFAAVLFHHASLAETVSAVLIEARGRQAVPTLVDVMGRAVDPRVRMVAWMTLKRLTDRDERIDDPSWTALVSE